jgi:hypothetical protein
MRTILLGISIAALLVACEGGDSPNPTVAKSAAANIVYTKDPRSGLCFGSITSRSYSGYEVVSITNVPCEKVDSLLVK